MALLYADDLSTLTYSVDKGEKMLRILNEECARFGLYVSFNKTYTQVSNDRPDKIDCSSLMKVAGHKIGNVP